MGNALLTFVLVLAGLDLCGGAMASDYRVVATIKNAGGLQSILAADTQGNLYGETANTTYGSAQVFRLLNTEGYNVPHILYIWYDLTFPFGGVTLNKGRILGTTYLSGSAPHVNEGTVFDLGRPHVVDLTTLHVFTGQTMSPTDGSRPISGLTAGPQHLFYGATRTGGVGKEVVVGTLRGGGTVFSISDSTTAPVYRVIHRFGGKGDGKTPNWGRLAVDAQGRLYGQTEYGGAYGGGTVYMMQKTDAGWQEQVLYSFAPGGSNLAYPFENVALDNAGNLYGCAPGGTHGQGGVFRLSPPMQAGGAWQQSVLYNFGDQVNDPVVSTDFTPPYAYGCGLTIDPATLFMVGTSAGGGAREGYGTIWELSPPAAGQTAWTETVGHSFGGDSHRVSVPRAAPLRVGNSYYGGGEDSNDVYAFTP